MSLDDSTVSQTGADARTSRAAIRWDWLAQVLAHPKLTHAQSKVAVALAVRANTETLSTWPSIETLQADTNIRKRDVVIEARRLMVELGLALADCHKCHLPVCAHPRPVGEPSCVECAGEVCTDIGAGHSWKMTLVPPDPNIEGQQKLPLEAQKGSPEVPKGSPEVPKGSPVVTRTASEQSQEQQQQAVDNSEDTKPDPFNALAQNFTEARIQDGADIRRPDRHAAAMAAKARRDPVVADEMRAYLADMEQTERDYQPVYAPTFLEDHPEFH